MNKRSLGTTLGTCVRHTLLLGFGALGVSSIATACGNSGDDSTFDPRNGQGGTAGSSNGGAAGSAGVLAGAGGSLVPPADGAGGSGGSDVSPDAACATGTVEAKLQPVSLFIMLDTSGSMVQDGSQKWANAKQGITSFVSSTGAAGLKVALAYFPNTDSACDGSGYDVADVVAPNGVAMGLLPGNRTAITNSLTAKATTSNGTPTEDALNGIKRYCTQYDAQNAGERCIGVLVTDGEPNGCNNNVTFLANIAGSAFTGSPSVPIYVMGMTGAVFTTLDSIASKGGTTEAINVNDGGSNAFLNALNLIRGQIMSCDFPVPQGANADKSRVNVRLTTASGVISLGKVANPAACVAKGWYYGSSETRIVLCPETCTTARSAPQNRIDVVLGCVSQPPDGPD
jgi:hypothetical protein